MFSNKRLELLSKYFADISKLFFGAGIAKGVLQRGFSVPNFLMNLLIVIGFLILSFFLQPKE